MSQNEYFIVTKVELVANKLVPIKIESLNNRNVMKIKLKDQVYL